MEIKIKNNEATKKLRSHHKLDANKSYEVISETNNFYYIPNPLHKQNDTNIAKTVAIAKHEADKV